MPKPAPARPRAHARPGRLVRPLIAPCVVLSVALAAAPAQATEGGGTAYPIGVNNVLSGIMPAPGETRYYDYAQNYDAHVSTDAEGRSRVPGFDLNLKANAFRVLHTWDGMIGRLPSRRA